MEFKCEEHAFVEDCDCHQCAVYFRDQYKKDAERYWWLRSRVPGSTYRIMGVIYSEGGKGVDAAIDAVMATANAAN